METPFYHTPMWKLPFITHHIIFSYTTTLHETISSPPTHPAQNKYKLLCKKRWKLKTNTNYFLHSVILSLTTRIKRDSNIGQWRQPIQHARNERQTATSYIPYYVGHYTAVLKYNQEGGMNRDILPDGTHQYIQSLYVTLIATHHLTLCS